MSVSCTHVCTGVHSQSTSSLGGSKSEYEVPENIKTLHHLALQYVNQVFALSPCTCVYCVTDNVGRLLRLHHIYPCLQGKPEIAVPFCKKAVHELKQRKGSEDPDVAAMLNILAVIYRYIQSIQQGPRACTHCSNSNQVIIHGVTPVYKHYLCACYLV